MIESLEVFCNDVPIGVLEKESHGYATEFHFRYREEVAEDQAVSLTMPPVELAYEGFGDVPDVFQVSLPEGIAAERLINRFGKGIRISDKFSLLRLVGRNMTGRITVGGTRTPLTMEERLLEMAGWGGQSAWMQDILESVDKNGFGISGVMPKLLMSDSSVQAHGIGIDTPYLSRSILKMETPAYFGICVAEHFALTASTHAQIGTVDATLNRCGDALFVKRFDVQEDGSHYGFEDGCALTGLSPVFKYQGCLEKLFIMIEDFGDEEHVLEDKVRLLRMVFLNDILCNGDAHLKNFGLLYTVHDNARLAPSYHVLDTTLFLPKDMPALTIRQFFPDEAQSHKRWMDDSALDELVDVAHIASINGRQMMADLIGSVQDSSVAYRAFLKTAPLSENRRAFGLRMLDTLDARIPHLYAQYRLTNHRP